jgi:ATP-dependent RNA helicase DeaD
VRSRDKLEILSRLLDMYDPDLALVFCNTKRGVDDLTTQLHTRGYFAEGLHGDLKQMQRDRVMAKFRNGSIDVLIATDVAARGIDVEDVDLVINYDVPQDVEYYVHRIGRTARAGRSGRAVTFVGPKEIYKLRSIQHYAKISIARIPLPTAVDVEETRINNLCDKIKQTVNDGKLERYQETVERIMVDDYTSLDIAAALLKLTLDTGREPEPAMDIPPGDSGVEPGMTRLYINLGRDDRIRPKDIVGAIAGETGIPGRSIGAISIYGTYSFVEVPQDVAAQVIERMQGKSIGAVRLTGGKTIGTTHLTEGGRRPNRR